MIKELLEYQAESDSLWSGEYKIPWNEKAFSERMLAEHLTQEHDLASRKSETVDAHVEWIHEKIFQGKPSKVLDLGCGPGLYLSRLEELGHECTGIDFSPASVAYAKELCSKSEVILGDVREVDFGQGYDFAMMLYSELNVFSPEDCRQILGKVYQALRPGGTLIVEVALLEALKAAAMSPPTWYRSSLGGLSALFSDKPHVTLVENRWFEEALVSLTDFWVMEEKTMHYRSTTQGYTDEKYRTLLQECGLKGVTFHGDFGRELSKDSTLQVITASRES